ncbi:Copper transport outer membrane protein, MctB [Caldanaerobius fijiensis DSM 17918]|uniref:Copper transport outer membrane protein, MctB n=1 Tax=Caldanaerobius fijiensis DSM 17918 TaxID=1121256 RepID=A0A1M4U9N3_9THEO|nr:copper transporter [Caldanaerobius fijiensis]SHE53317.1 Copper transport outer membrane protein, MctB [Caldanaerobius fijiensis DSM 17918]
MFINLKYYVITIAAIFMALGIGIYIGFMLDGQDIFVQQQDSLINELEKKFNQFSNENNNLKNQIKDLNAQLKLNDSFINAVYPRLIEGKLKDLNIAIIETNDDYLYTGIKSTIKSAGGNVVSEIRIYPYILINDDVKKQEIINYAAIKGENISQDKVVQYVVEKINQALTKKVDIDVLNFLKSEGVIDFSGYFNVQPDYVIICGGSLQKTNYPELIDIPLIKLLKQQNVPIIGIERSDVTFSYIDYYKKLRLSTVDDIDLIYGKTALVFAIKNEPGNYGIKKSATSGLLPDINNSK